MAVPVSLCVWHIPHAGKEAVIALFKCSHCALAGFMFVN